MPREFHKDPEVLLPSEWVMMLMLLVEGDEG